MKVQMIDMTALVDIIKTRRWEGLVMIIVSVVFQYLGVALWITAAALIAVFVSGTFIEHTRTRREELLSFLKDLRSHMDEFNKFIKPGSYCPFRQSPFTFGYG